MIKRRFLCAALILPILAVLVACGSGGSAGKPAAVSGSTPAAAKQADVKEEGKISIYNFIGMKDDLFKESILDPLSKRFPNVTFEMVKTGKGTSIPELVAAGSVPDILFGGGPQLQNFLDANLAEDLDPFVKQYQFDLSKLEDFTVDYMHTLGGGKLYGLPYFQKPTALYYNKAIFDKFSVSYPKDNMTWDDVYELAKKLNRTDGNVHYVGFHFNAPFFIGQNQQSLPLADEAAKKALVDNDGWKAFFDNFSRFYQIPGNEFDRKTFGNPWGDKRLAMFAYQTMFGALEQDTAAGLNWDVVTLPTMKGMPGIGTQGQNSFLSLSNTSKSKPLAFKVMTYLLSPEIQVANTKKGDLSVLKDPAIKEQIGKGKDYLNGKNLAALLKLKPAKTSVRTKYDTAVSSILTTKLYDVMEGNKDVNTALREAEEEANKKIASMD